jgi:LPS-assembly lipoprotein
MWWSRALVLVALFGLGPAGCGFRPLLAVPDSGPGAVSSRETESVAIGPIKDRLGQMLRNALVERLTPRGEPADPRCVMAVELTRTASDLGYRRDSYATLGSLTLSGMVTMNCGGVGVLSDNISTLVNFDYLGPRYASIAMERDAEERAVVQMADEIRSRVAVELARYRQRPDDPRYRKAPEVDTMTRPNRAGQP